MLDAEVVAVSSASVWRVLRQPGRLTLWKCKPSSHGQGFQQPRRPHRHWHVDFSYLNLAGTLYYLCNVFDVYSRHLVHWEIRESMTEAKVEISLLRARERFPQAWPRLISDNGPQFIARDFKEFIRISGMRHVRNSPFYPQSNGKIERWHHSLNGECMLPGAPLSIHDACRLAAGYVDHYNQVRLHTSLGYVTPLDKLEGQELQILAERDRKLEDARQEPQLRRRKAFAPLPDRTGDSSTVALNCSGRVRPKPVLLESKRAEG
jgi:transposase InsO family protein